MLVRAKLEKSKIILLSDLNGMKRNESIPMNFLMKQMQFNKDCYKFNKEYVACVCILCNNLKIKNILLVYFTMIKQASPYKICKDAHAVNVFLKDKYDIDLDSHMFMHPETDVIRPIETGKPKVEENQVEVEVEENEVEVEEELDEEKLKQEVREQLLNTVDMNRDDSDNTMVLEWNRLQS